MVFRSLRFRIQLWHSLLLMVIVASLSVVYYFFEKQNKLRFFDLKLHQYHMELLPPAMREAQNARPDLFKSAGRRGPPIFKTDSPDEGDAARPMPAPPPPRRGPPTSEEGERPRRSSRIDPSRHVSELIDQYGFFFIVWSPKKELVYRSENAPIGVESLPEQVPIHGEPVGENFERARLLHLAIPNRGWMTIGADVSSYLDELSGLKRNLVFADLGIILFGMIGGWLLTSRAIGTIQSISQAARKIASGERSNRIGVKDTDTELGQLVEVLNDSFEKLDYAFEQQIRFTADASHELRTPVSIILSQIELALARDRSVEDYKQYFKICEQQASHMRDLLNSLLDLARVDSGELDFNFEDLDLAELVRECIEWIRPMAEERKVQLIANLQPARSMVDGNRLEQVAINLLSNAVKHAGEGGWVRIETSTVDSQLILRISDSGSGIPEEDLPHIFERFYRANLVRNSSEGSVGLGLAIAKAIVDSHKGTISVSSDAQSEAVFEVRLPSQ